MNHKYLIIADLGHESPVIFPASLPHDQICKQCMVNNEAVSIVAAGSVGIELLGDEEMFSYATAIVKCSGGSETLQIESRGDVDAEIIRRFLCGED